MASAPPDNCVTRFPPFSAIDSCSVSNLFCSSRLLGAAKGKNLGLVIASYVRWECLEKRRTTMNAADTEAMARFRRELELNRHVTLANLTIGDLREIARLMLVKRLGVGEIAAMTVARKMRAGFLSDDKGARTLASTQFADLEVRTIPHLVGWLIYANGLGDGDVSVVVADNFALRGNHGFLGPYIQACYEHARLLQLKK